MSEEVEYPRVPQIGDWVKYIIPDWQGSAVNSRRKDAQDKASWHSAVKSGAVVHQGNLVRDGD